MQLSKIKRELTLFPQKNKSSTILKFCFNKKILKTPQMIKQETLTSHVIKTTQPKKQNKSIINRSGEQVFP